MATVVVVTLKVAVVAPAATVTVAGTDAEALSEARLTVTGLPAAATPESVTVPVEVAPPTTVAGFRATDVSVGARIWRFAELVPPDRVAVIAAVVSAATGVVAMLKLALVAPAATVTVAGTVAFGLLEARLITVPPAGAAFAILTVPVEPTPPTTGDVFTVRVTEFAAVIVSTAVFDTPFAVAVTVDWVLVVTATVVTAKVALVAPAGTVTVAGTAEEALLSARATTKPPVGAALLSVTVPCDATPPTTEVGLSATAVSVGALTARFTVCAVLCAVALIAAVLFVVTPSVVTVKVPVVAPAAIVSVAGRVALASLEVRATVAPPAGAALVRVTVPVEVAPPSTDVGSRARVFTPNGITERSAKAEEPLTVAVTRPVLMLVTAVVVRVRVPVLVAAGTTSVAGTGTATSFEARFNVRPPAGALLPRVTVKTAWPPPKMLVGTKATVAIFGPVTARVAVFVAVPDVAVIVADRSAATAAVVAVKVAEVAPAATVTEAGTVTEAWFEARVMTRPPVGAGLVNVIVPVALTPPTTEVGAMVNAPRL